jgi:1-acyl-sn-glycerol-3-phosphate acyltransferase
LEAKKRDAHPLNELIVRGLRKYFQVFAGVYFREFATTGTHHIPKEQPLIFTPNHQNAFLDGILVALSAPRRPWYLVRASVFNKPLVKKLLTFFHLMPVYRPRDQVDILEANDAVFDACRTILRIPGCILIFPEGNHGEELRLRAPLKKGFARIALSMDQHELPALQPVGIFYENRGMARTRVLVNYGAPIPLEAFKELYEKNQAEAIRNLTEALEKAMYPLVLHLGSAAEYTGNLQAYRERWKFKPRVVKQFEFNQDLAAHLGDYPPVKRRKHLFGFQIWGVPFAILGIISSWFILILDRRVQKLTRKNPDFGPSLHFVVWAFLAGPVFFVQAYVLGLILQSPLAAGLGFMAMIISTLMMGEYYARYHRKG